jgi:putative ABC transport system ATP-binding protein
VGPMNAPIVSARDLVKSHRRGSEEVHALRGVSFALAAGEVVALVGRSGSGKTTLLNVLAGWESQDSGVIDWRLSGAGDAAAHGSWDRVAVVPQSLGLVEELTVFENVELPARLAGVAPPEARAERVDEHLDALGIGHLADRLPEETSLGEQQRCALARALIAGPRLLLADEPTGHLDTRWAGVLFDVLRAAARAGACCLVATHHDELRAHADRVLTIADGELVG